MKEGDGQGWISFDSYRILMKLYDKWSPEQEKMFQDIVAGKDISMDEINTFFPVVKAQYAGPLDNAEMPLMAGHKYSLFPMIPNVMEHAQANLKNLHTRMMNHGIDYITYQSGSKISTLVVDGTADKLYSNDEERTINVNDGFVKNPIFLSYLKYQTHIDTVAPH
jgi:hypothetical protein